MTLKTERLILRPWRETDAEDLYKYAKDERVGPIAGWSPHKSIEESAEVIRTVFAQEGVFAVALKEDDIAIGLIGLIRGAKSNFSISENEAEISYWIGIPFWGKGYIPEAIREVTRYGFEDLELTDIWSGYFDGNEKSKRAQEKCGYRHHHIEKDKPYALMNDIHLDNQDFVNWMEKISAKLNEIGKDLTSFTQTKDVLEEDEKIMDNQDLAFLLKVSYRTLQRYRTAKKLPYFMIGHKTYYRVNDVRGFVREHMDMRSYQAFEKSQSTDK